MSIAARFPESHLRVMRDASDPIHRACDFLVESPETGGLNVDVVNEQLHSPSFYQPWPGFLVAFASNGCADYFAYDMRESPPQVVYVDPDDTPEEVLADPETLRYPTFDHWYDSQVESCTCQRCRSRDARFEPSPDKRWLLRICPACGFQEPAIRVDA